jgi:hypothetical protein
MLPKDVIGKNETWESYFYIRSLGPGAYYVCFKGTKENIDTNISFFTWGHAVDHIQQKWRDYLNESFERAFLEEEKK